MPDEGVHQGPEGAALHQHRGAPERAEVSGGPGDTGSGTWPRLRGLRGERFGPPKVTVANPQVHHPAPQRRHHVQAGPGPAAVSAVPAATSARHRVIYAHDHSARLYRGRRDRINTQKRKIKSKRPEDTATASRPPSWPPHISSRFWAQAAGGTAGAQRPGSPGWGCWGRAACGPGGAQRWGWGSFWGGGSGPESPPSIRPPPIVGCGHCCGSAPPGRCPEEFSRHSPLLLYISFIFLFFFFLGVK